MSNHKKLTADEKNALAAKLLGDEIVTLMATIKAKGEGEGAFEVIFTSGVKDRHGETVNPDGWVFDNYMLNPVVLFAHDYGSLPVGAVDDIRRDGDKWIAKGRFASEDANPFAMNVRKLYEAGFLKTVSVGFMPLELDAQFNSIKQELLEISFVPVPANPEALSLMKELGLAEDELKVKGLLIEAKTTDVDTAALETQIKELTASKLAVEQELADVKAGRVLSDKNRTLIRECADTARGAILVIEKSVVALEDLLNSTEPSSGDDDTDDKGVQGVAYLRRIQRSLALADKAVEDGLRLINRSIGK